MSSLSRDLIGLAAAAVIVTVAASSANAVPIVYDATLLGSNEFPPTNSPATGFATLTVDGNTLAVFATFTGLIGGAATAAHIHCCAAPGIDTVVALPFPAFPAATSGTYQPLNPFNLTDSAIYTSLFLINNDHTAAGAEAALKAGLAAGDAYVDIHDSVFPGGEIRGWDALAPVPVPEPSGLLLLSSALAFLGLIRRRFPA